MTETSITIKHSRGNLDLFLPAYFENATLAKIRSVFKILGAELWRNEEALEKLPVFFLAWQNDLSEQLGEAWQAEKEAEKKSVDADTQRARFGSMVTPKMKEEALVAWQVLKKARENHRRTVKAFDRATKIAEEYKQLFN